VEHTHTHTWPVCFKDIQDVSDALISSHWLRSLQRIQFKVAVLTYKVLHGCAPSCLLRIPLIYLYCDCLSVWYPGSAASVCVGVYETTWSCHRTTGACPAVGGRSWTQQGLCYTTCHCHCHWSDKHLTAVVHVLNGVPQQCPYLDTFKRRLDKFRKHQGRV